MSGLRFGEKISDPIDRFFQNCDEDLVRDLIEALHEEVQIDHRLLPDNAVPCVFIIGTWLRNYRNIEIIEDYDECVAYQRSLYGKGCHHPALYLTSCICILYDRGQHPSEDTFEAEKIPEIYDTIMSWRD